MIAKMRESTEELTDDELSVINTIIAGKWAWTSAIFFSVKGLDAAVADLLSAGDAALVVAWETPEGEITPGMPPCGKVLTLTPWGACRMNTMIVEDGVSERPRWLRPGEFRLDRSPVQPQFACRLRLPERIEDPRPGPEDEVDEETDGVECLVDEWTGEPIRAFEGVDESGLPLGDQPTDSNLAGGIKKSTKIKSGVPIVVDRRLAKGKGRRRGKGKKRGKAKGK